MNGVPYIDRTLVAVDPEGTFVNDNGTLHTSNADALQELAKREDIVLTILSSQPYEFIKGLSKVYGLKGLAIASNGGAIVDCIDGNPWRTFEIGELSGYIAIRDSWLEDYEHAFHHVRGNVVSLEVRKLDLETATILSQGLPIELWGQIHQEEDGSHTLRITATGVSKGSGLGQIAWLHSIPQNQIILVGGDNCASSAVSYAGTILACGGDLARVTDKHFPTAELGGFNRAYRDYIIPFLEGRL